MDIHKPKPWHGLREFLKEYLIIVVGVLTALAAEAVVEEMRWAERTRQTEEHLRAELHGITVEAAGRIAIETCSAHMLEKLEAALVRSGDDWRPPHVISFQSGIDRVQQLVLAPKGGWSTQAWRDAQSDGTANHLPQKELLAFGDIYEQIARVKVLNEQETSDMAELNSLAAVRRLDTGTRAQYLRLIYRVRQDLLGLAINAPQLIEGTVALGVQKGGVGEYGPAMANYQAVCRRFEAGETNIDFKLPPAPLAPPPK